ncbi:hypothetical protein SAMN05660206_107147 [Sphingobacterium wenxiniae]|uniref:Uncharacterized protein n=1 Tax=Sphingobacterium wenxiniae TaxID=683125 RepID=A0A1I6TYX8_9SPHI|nr:hypothetical protein SAMN05660206_107147 [Sphingobacterium wenxiniae]
MSNTIKYIFIFLCFSLPWAIRAEQSKVVQNCEQITKITLDKLVPLVDKNDFTELESILSTIQTACGENEFTQRMRILRALLEKKSSGELIADYLDKNYHETLVMRWDYAAEEQHQRIYRDNKSDFNYIPLNHAIDSLTQVKATALLNSTSFNLTEQEREIVLLFADYVDDFYQSYEQTTPRKPTALESSQEYFTYKSKGGVNLYAGIEFPITGSNPLFKGSPTVALMYSSPLHTNFLYELGLKVRINSNDRDFEYLLHNEVEIVNSSASYAIGGTLGYKLFDNDKFILYPKVGLFFESTSTGLSEVTYYDNGYYEDGYGNSSVRYNNVNTMRTTLALSAMRHIAKKKYIGLEAAYHYVPYNWDENLITAIQPNYASLQLFFRF